MAHKNHYVVSYDIVDDRRRHRVAEALKDFGVRVQKSVFECLLDDARRQRLEARLAKLIDRKTDTVLIYFLCAACMDRKSALGLATASLPESVKIL